MLTSKVGRYTEHRISLLKNLAAQLIEHEIIETTHTKAKVLRPFIEKIITKGREYVMNQNNNENKHRNVFLFRFMLKHLHNNHKVVKKLIEVISPRLLNRNGGYTRIILNGFRNGDKANKSLIQIL
ncbi:50S ribosomal protein L17 [Rickettsiales bacterium (ex Bugula neritina AB1)]|nr:50S ribosomal protein L17 [Rickettsiales bacterium (ex Bugula neritina AB1)]